MQVWTDFLSDDFDPEIRPDWPWNQPRTESSMEEEGGETYDLTAEELRRLERKRQPKLEDKSSEDGSDSLGGGGITVQYMQ